MSMQVLVVIHTSTVYIIIILHTIPYVSGLPIGTTCLTAWAMIAHGMILVVTVLGAVGLGLAIHTRRQMGPKEPKKPPPGRKRSANWNKVEDLKSQKSFSVDPPAARQAVSVDDSWA